MLVQERDDPAVLTGTELVEPVDGKHEVAFGDRQPRLEPAAVREVVHVDFRRAGYRSDVPRLVVHVIPPGQVVETADHVDAIRGHHEVAVVQIVLVGRVQSHRCPRLLPGIRLLRGDSPGQHAHGQDQYSTVDSDGHTSLLSGSSSQYYHRTRDPAARRRLCGQRSGHLSWTSM